MWWFLNTHLIDESVQFDVFVVSEGSGGGMELGGEETLEFGDTIVVDAMPTFGEEDGAILGGGRVSVLAVLAVSERVGLLGGGVGDGVGGGGGSRLGRRRNAVVHAVVRHGV